MTLYFTRFFILSTRVENYLISAINDACLVYDGNRKLVIDAYFHTNKVSIRGAALSLIVFSTKVENYLISAINDACLVYDGKLVIDAYFHTNDVSIRGAGPLTKFQRKYHAEKWSHCNFNSKEVGVHVS